MSDVVKLSLKKKKIKAVVRDLDNDDSFQEFTQLVEKEREEEVHKHELETEFKKGFEEGQIKAAEKLEEKHSEALLKQSEEFYNILKSFEDKFKSYENEFHKLVIGVSTKISEKIIKHELNQKSDIQRVLNENLSKVIGANEIVIKLNPDDYNIIEESSTELTNKSIAKIRFETNPNIEVGGCLIETEVGNLDARIDSQINVISKALEENLTLKEIDWC